MKKSNILSSPVKKVKVNYFTGPVKLHEISGITKPIEHDMYHVIFRNSARTKLHYHTGGQLLIVTKGNGSLVFYNKKSSGVSKFRISRTKMINLNYGDTVYIPAKMLHTHGSVKKNQIFSHIALNFHPTKYTKPRTIWFESDLRSIVTGKID
ncbi:Cupin domain containing protein [Marine Group I thaumarchaeote SCGC AAA799-O18]|jgi:quercetin dioxygenase-like cupin family protein|nr:Cupin domain containing protein [Marine Group I thaumarchaeote SCGC AAA799-O18]